MFIGAQLPLVGHSAARRAECSCWGRLAECSIRRRKQLSGQDSVFGQEWRAPAIAGLELAMRGEIAQLLYRWLKWLDHGSSWPDMRTLPRWLCTPKARADPTLAQFS